MSRPLSALSQLSSAEEFLEFLGIAYDPRVVEVNRLHILKRYAFYVAQSQASAERLSDGERLQLHRDAMQGAYDDFLAGTALDYRLFKVLQERAPAFVPLTQVAGETATKAEQ